MTLRLSPEGQAAGNSGENGVKGRSQDLLYFVTQEFGIYQWPHLYFWKVSSASVFTIDLKGPTVDFLPEGLSREEFARMERAKVIGDTLWQKLWPFLERHSDSKSSPWWGIPEHSYRDLYLFLLSSLPPRQQRAGGSCWACL